MEPHEIAESYDQLADHWASDKFNRENGVAAHRLAMRFLDAPNTALDVGCGSSGRIIDLLLAEGLKVEGLDISEEMTRLARNRHPQTRFHHADILEWEPPHSYDFITAWDSIWHIPLTQQEAVIRKLCDHLTDGGVLIFTAGGTDSASEVTNPCTGTDVPLYHATLGIPKLLHLIDECKCVCRHLEFDQWPEKHLHLVVQKARE